jgi:hypothetical protein
MITPELTCLTFCAVSNRSDITPATEYADLPESHRPVFMGFFVVGKPLLIIAGLIPMGTGVTGIK